MGIKAEDDAADLQNDLFHIYQWSVENNMQFNALKFELLRYGNRDDLKENTAYVNPEFELIEEKENVKDLGVNMTNNCKFNLHITKIAESAKKIASWILRTFETREPQPMMLLFKSLVRPLLEYASPLWTPISKMEINMLERIQKSFITKINGISRDYCVALRQLNLFSLEERRNRFLAIHVWKILENLAPNLSMDQEKSIVAQTDCNHRRGRTCKLYSILKTPSHLLKARKQTLRFQGVKAFNRLPKEIRNITGKTVEQFKVQLDKYLKSKMGIPIVSCDQSNRQSNRLCKALSFPHPYTPFRYS